MLVVFLYCCSGFCVVFACRCVSVS